jgi:ribosomal protein L24
MTKARRDVVQKVYPELNKVVVEGVNVHKKHKKPTQATPEGSVLDIYVPLRCLEGRARSTRRPRKPPASISKSSMARRVASASPARASISKEDSDYGRRKENRSREGPPKKKSEKAVKKAAAPKAEAPKAAAEAAPAKAEKR